MINVGLRRSLLAAVAVLGIACGPVPLAMPSDSCSPGIELCECLEGQCAEALECSPEDVCVQPELEPPPCEPGSELCECVGSQCAHPLQCSPESVCVQPEPGAAPCAPGTTFCRCWNSTCIAGLKCDAQDQCVPDRQLPDDEIPLNCTPGTHGCRCNADDQCEDGTRAEPFWLAGCFCSDRSGGCVEHFDCLAGSLCQGLVNGYAGCLALEYWALSVRISDYEIGCHDGTDDCELMFYETRRDRGSGEWLPADFTAIHDPMHDDHLRVLVWENDIITDRFVGGFQVQILNALHEFKKGNPIRVVGEGGDDWIELTLWVHADWG